VANREVQVEEHE